MTSFSMGVIFLLIKQVGKNMCLNGQMKKLPHFKRFYHSINIFGSNKEYDTLVFYSVKSKNLKD